jgi:hypothetical protein
MALQKVRGKTVGLIGFSDENVLKKYAPNYWESQEDNRLVIQETGIGYWEIGNWGDNREN